MKQKLVIFGTGHATVTKCYNTCFALCDTDEYFMIDAGGGNGILTILENMEISVGQIHHLFVTHGHTDHILGVIWMIRMAAQEMLRGSYAEDFTVYGHGEVIAALKTICELTLAKKHKGLLGQRIFLRTVEDGETVRILSYDVTFFDIYSSKLRQFGFTTCLADGSTLSFTGDEPYNEACERYVACSKWLLHEAFCLYADKERFSPYEKHHGTVLDAARTAENLRVSNLVLLHSEDKTYELRRESYEGEAKQAFSGRVFAAMDGDIIDLEA